MFEVGFSELCLVGLIALIVIGPEKLPKVARVAGFWLGKTRSMVANLKEEARGQFQIEELQQLLVEQHRSKALQDLIADTKVLCTMLEGVNNFV